VSGVSVLAGEGGSAFWGLWPFEQESYEMLKALRISGAYSEVICVCHGIDRTLLLPNPVLTNQGPYPF